MECHRMARLLPIAVGGKKLYRRCLQGCWPSRQVQDGSCHPLMEGCEEGVGRATRCRHLPIVAEDRDPSGVRLLAQKNRTAHAVWPNMNWSSGMPPWCGSGGNGTTDPHSCRIDQKKGRASFGETPGLKI